MSESSTILLLIFGTLLFTLFAVFTILYIALQKKKQYHHHMEKQEMQHRFSKELLSSQLEVQEQTLKHLSAELHDNIAQLLGMAKMQLHVLEDSADEEYKEIATETTQLVADAIKDIRQMSHTMNGTYILDHGLKASIQKDLKRIEDATRIKCNFNLTGEAFSIGNEKELMLFRIIQECIANAVKHGKPYSINVSLEYTAAALRVVVADDGKGFDTGTTQSDGLGLNNIKERTALLSGEVHFKSESTKGTTVTISIPKHD